MLVWNNTTFKQFLLSVSVAHIWRYKLRLNHRAINYTNYRFSPNTYKNKIVIKKGFIIWSTLWESHFCGVLSQSTFCLFGPECIFQRLNRLEPSIGVDLNGMEPRLVFYFSWFVLSMWTTYITCRLMSFCQLLKQKWWTAAWSMILNI